MQGPPSGRRRRQRDAASESTARSAPSPGRRKWIVASAIVVVAVVIGVAIGSRFQGDPPVPSSPPVESAPQAPPIAALPSSPFLNVHQGTYVGSDTCRQCHEEEHDSFRQTGMGRSMAEIVAAHEPPDASVEHRATSRRYETIHDGKTLRHRELLVRTDREPIVVNDHPVAYVIGSGHHARGYLVEIDGFLVESPLTWYTSRQAWDMSPGYEDVRQMGFQRPVDQSCLVCHAGRSSAIGGTFHRMKIHEQAISCERCHGPGSIHVARQEAVAAGKAVVDGAQADAKIDYTIVNPKHLSRELAGDVCAQCHLRSVASSLVRGRELDDFRPGIPLSAIRVDYRLAQAGDEMSVVGHVAQMRASRCYQQSQMTCMSCHNPHDMPPQQQQVDYYRQRCLACHDLQDCRVEPAERSRISAENDCVHCHMPRSPVDIPHVAFTHHRIGIHDLSQLDEESPAPPRREPSELEPLDDLSSWSQAERDRALGLAYLELTQTDAGAPFAKHYRQQGQELISAAWDAGLRDADLAAPLAQSAGTAGDERAITFAEHVLAQKNVPARLRGNALLVKTDWLRRRGQIAQAADTVREVTRLRRWPSDWVLLGQLEQQAGNQPAAVAAIEKAAEIDPLRGDCHQALVDYYRQTGNQERIRWHEALLPRSVAP